MSDDSRAAASSLRPDNVTELNVGFVVRSTTVPLWIGALAREVGADPSLRTCAICVDPTASPLDAPLSFRAYERLDALLFRRPTDALEPVCLKKVLPKVPIIAFNDEHEALERALRLDVVLNFGSEYARVVGSASYGAWQVRHTDQAGALSEPWLFHEMRDGAVFRTSIEAYHHGVRYVIYESYGASDPVSLHRMRNLASWKAAAALLNRLRVVSAGGWESLISSGAAPDTAESHQPPRPRAATVGRHAVAVGAGVAARRLGKLFFREEWFISTRPRGPGQPPDNEPAFARISSPRGHYFADPFPFNYRGQTYVFFESFSYKRDRAAIWFLGLDSAGRPLGRIGVALERDYHLSYPFVFEYAGDAFMIPESSEHRTVDLYRAIDFPHSWQLEERLFVDVRAVDATVCKIDKRLYLFTNIAAEGASLDDELHLFSAERPQGPWRSHPANPVVADVRSARPAGRIFRSHGHLIRPSQDCSRGYGRAVVLNRIEVLTQSDYKESEIGRIEPRWMRGISRTHTFNVLDHVEVIDGVRRVPRVTPRIFQAGLRAEQ